MTTDPFREEIKSVAWLFEEVRAGKRLPVMEAGAIVHCLRMALGSNSNAPIPVVSGYVATAYVPVNAINVAIMAMAAGRAMNLAPDAVLAIGMAGLLHDIGMVRMPTELVVKKEELSPEDRETLARHTSDGAAIILEAGSAPDIAAVAAYEHHLRPDGRGYPTLTYPRKPHAISRLIAVCSVYHALTSVRPFRAAFTPAEALTIMKGGSRRDYDSEMVNVVISLLQNRENRLAHGT